MGSGNGEGVGGMRLKKLKLEKAYDMETDKYFYRLSAIFKRRTVCVGIAKNNSAKSLAEFFRNFANHLDGKDKKCQNNSDQ